MAGSNCSFDIVSSVDDHELSNAVNQARKEIDNRYDFKGTGSRVEVNTDSLVIHSSDDFHIKAIREVLESKMTRRGVPLKSFAWEEITSGPKGTVKCEAGIQRGIDQDKAREIVKFLKKVDKKLNVAIQQDQVRVTGKSRDALQNAISELKENDFGIPLQFTNYR
ncbi:MAG: YajQ family cyclic di-GMP-binding protein [Actinobacteria bacterium]|nr:YajQ family cyclic di-GMP-binding protein [Actinomycetota bacterium]